MQRTKTTNSDIIIQQYNNNALCPSSTRFIVERGVIARGGHSPFQVLDASAIEGIRGLAGESSSIYSCIQIYKALTPPRPPSVSRRDGRTRASVLCGIL